ncbi:hypothetical protein SAMN04488498_107191 [Mesorhizobium albiziae]|uniref:Uncharacterized protein n=1 Tax=Neomesorhizobium albiziae TaxID=335020 RepID=A0A1I4A7U3_9HYPH|nr:hypothetical protein SAMN04488498_107191 [Mesorhizobium albiziae]
MAKAVVAQPPQAMLSQADGHLDAAMLIAASANPEIPMSRSD